MAETFTPTSVLNLSDTSLNTAINNNFNTLATLLADVLSRTGVSPNQMSAMIDMNSNRIINLPNPSTGTEPVTKTYGDLHYGDSLANATAAAASATDAASSATSASGSATSATSSATSASGSASTATTKATTATTQAGIATTQATAAAASAAAAAATEAALVAGLAATSTTSTTIGTGAQTFTTQAGKLYTTGQFLQISSNANPANYMHGTVTSYSGTSLVMNVTDVGGSGTLADWNINLSGTQGPAGSGTISGMTSHGVMVATGTSAGTSTAALTNGQLVVGVTGSNPAPVTVSGDVTINSSGVTAIKSSVSLTTPVLGVATGTSFNGLTVTSTTGSFTLTNGKTLAVTNSLTLSGTDSTTMTFPSTSSTVITLASGGALTAGFTSASVSAGTKTSGTYTFDPTAGAVQHATNGGAHTFAPPVTMGAWMLDYVNNVSAGTLTISGWTKVDGDAFDTTNTHAFRCYLSVGNSGSHLSVKRLV